MFPWGSQTCPCIWGSLRGLPCDGQCRSQGPWGTWGAAVRSKPCALVCSARKVRHESVQGGRSLGPHRRAPALLIGLPAPAGVQGCGGGRAANPDPQRMLWPGTENPEGTSISPRCFHSDPNPQLTGGGPGLRRPSPSAPPLTTGTSSWPGRPISHSPPPSGHPDPPLLVCFHLSATESGQPRMQLWGLTEE